jgi:5-methylcytosine-specific restriction endonuclease McrA
MLRVVSSRTKRHRVLEIVATDATFEKVLVRGAMAWVGRCIHCNARLVIDSDGETGALATIEHIVPRSQGGTDAPENLAMACARCNHEKGRRHDARGARDARAAEVLAKLQAKRRERWRDPHGAG